MDTISVPGSIPGSYAGNDDSNIEETQLPGMLYKPKVIIADLQHFERHDNGYNINLVPDQLVGLGAYECQAIMIWKQYTAPDITSIDATIAKPDYLSTLASLGNFDFTNRQCILIKSPSVSFGDKCDNDLKHVIQFPSKESKEAVQAAEGNLPESRLVSYDLIVCPEGILLDNRVFSDDDHAIKVTRSMPDAYKEPEIDDHLLIWHNFWIVAVKGTTRKKMKHKKLSIKEEKEAQKKRMQRI